MASAETTNKAPIRGGRRPGGGFTQQVKEIQPQTGGGKRDSPQSQQWLAHPRVAL